MPVDRKPLFRPEVLRPALRSFPAMADPAGRAAVRRWAALLAEYGRGLKEEEHLPKFLSDVFGAALGYTDRADVPAGEPWTLRRERHAEATGTFADAALGRFAPDDEAGTPVVALEGKGPADPLDRPHGGRRLSAVEQALGYARDLRCEWAVVTNLRETRLYHRGSDLRTYERFPTADLAQKDAVFARFVFLLGADRVAPPHGDNHLPGLLKESERTEKGPHPRLLRGLRRPPGGRLRRPRRRQPGSPQGNGPRPHADVTGPRAVLRVLRGPRPAAAGHAQGGLRAPRPV